MRTQLASLAFSIVALLPGVALAQADQLAAPVDDGEHTADADATTPTSTSPQTRVDVAVPTLGLGTTTAHGDPALTVGVGVTVVDRSGHGARVQVGFLDTDDWQGGLLGPTNAHATQFFVDASYAHRFRLAGDDRLGLGLDLYGGASMANVQFHQATSGFCWSDCGQPPVVAESVADGWHLGANAGASLDFRASVFVMGLDVRAHTLFALQQDEPGEQLFQGDVSASLYFGFGFY